MTEFTEFNTKYQSAKAKEYREKISDLMFNMEYLGMRMQKLQKEASVVRAEYLVYLGVQEDGQNEKK